MLERLLASSFLVCFAASAFAQQTLKMRDGETVGAKISMREVSRIAIDQARVRSIVGARGGFDVQVDKDIGQIFIRPVSGAKLTTPINLFLTDDAGRTFGLVLTPEDIPAESVLISASPTGKQSHQPLRDAPYLEVIKDLIRSLALNDENAFGFEVVDHQREIPIWEEVRMTLERTWVGDGIIGERYTLVNVTDGEVRLAEQEFLRRGVLAVGIDNTLLSPKQSTGVYVVREAPDGQ